MTLSEHRDGEVSEDRDGEVEIERIPPVVTPSSIDFWTAGAAGELRIARCQRCALFIHPPAPYCPACRSGDVNTEPVSGEGTVYSFAIERYTWIAGFPAPYVVAEIELVEQESLRLHSNIVGCRPESVFIGMEVKVCFARDGEIYFPLFQPANT
jgi:uncharacterized protein